MNLDGITAKCAWFEDDAHQNPSISRIGKKLPSTLPRGSQNVEYKFFIEVIERCYAGGELCPKQLPHRIIERQASLGRTEVVQNSR